MVRHHGIEGTSGEQFAPCADVAQERLAIAPALRQEEFSVVCRRLSEPSPADANGCLKESEPMEREYFAGNTGITYCEAYLISGFAKLLGDWDISGKMTEIGAEFPREENSAHLSALRPSKSRLTGSELSVQERIALCPHAENI